MNTPLRRSGMARVLKGSHSFTCDSLTVLPAHSQSLSLLAFQSSRLDWEAILRQLDGSATEVRQDRGNKLNAR